MVKKAMFATAIASVRTFDPSSPAGAITRLVDSASGVAAAAVYAPELIKTEQRWLMDAGCPYDLTTRGSIPADWHTEIYQSDPVVLATANGEIQSVRENGSTGRVKWSVHSHTFSTARLTCSALDIVAKN